MALSKNKGADAQQKPAFEQEPGSDTAVADRPTDTATQAPAPAPAASTAVATVAGTAVANASEVAAKAKGFQKEVEAMKGAFDFQYGNFDVYKGIQGELQQSGGDENSLGRWAKVRMLGWDEHFEISPGEDGASSKEFVAYSKDGVIVDSVIGEGDQRAYVGKTVGEYVAYLRESEDFENAATRRFIDIACALLGADSGDAPVGTVIQVTLSQSSIPAFSKYQEQLKTTARCVEMGLPGFSLPQDPFTFFFVREPASKGEKKWTKLRIEQTLPNKL